MHGLLLLPRMQPMTLRKHAPPLLLFKAYLGKTPYDWQLDDTEAILLLGIISPLKVLQQDQVCDYVFPIQSYFFHISRFEDFRK